jgi:hypothetical protein
MNAMSEQVISETCPACYGKIPCHHCGDTGLSTIARLRKCEQSFADLRQADKESLTEALAAALEQMQRAETAEAKVADLEATIADLQLEARKQFNRTNMLASERDTHAATIDRLNHVNTLQRAMLAAYHSEPIPFIVLDDDEKLMQANLQKCFSTDTLALRVSVEHYRYLAEQVISLRTHIKRAASTIEQTNHG